MATAKKPAAKRAAPAKKPAQRRSKTPPSATDEFEAGELPAEEPTLRPTGTPGVYLNRMNALVDRNGVALSFKDVLRKDKDNMRDVIGVEVDTPAKLLKAVALDPRFRMGLRIDAAKNAAPYFDRKMPTAIDGGVNPDGTSIPLFDASKLQGLDSKELKTMLALMEKAGLAS